MPTQQEIDRRYKNIRSRMEREGLDALIVCGNLSRRKKFADRGFLKRRIFQHQLCDLAVQWEVGQELRKFQSQAVDRLIPGRQIHQTAKE